MLTIEDPVNKVIDCVYLLTRDELKTIAKYGPFESQNQLATRMKKQKGSIKKLFSKYNAKLVIDTKRPSLNELGRTVYDYIKDKEAIKLFDTAKPSQLLELYASSEYPDFFAEITGHSSLMYFQDFKKKGFLKRDGQRILAKTIENVIAKREGTFRLLTPKAQKFIDDINNVFNLMSYYSASSVIFRRVDEDPVFWKNQLPFDDYGQFIKILQTIENTKVSLKKASTSKVDLDELKEVKSLFQIRTSHLPFGRLPVSNDFVVEGKEIIRGALDKQKNPDFLVIGQEAYFGSELTQNYFPLAMIRENSGQLISRDGKPPKKGSKVAVIENPKPSGWMEKQKTVLEFLGAEGVKKGEAPTYTELGKAISGGTADMFSVTAPLNYLAEIYGYKTVVFPLHMRNLEQVLFNNALFLVKKEMLFEIPEVTNAVLDMSQRAYQDYIGSSDGASLKFEHFIGIPATRKLNSYCKKTLGLTNNEFEEFIEDKRYNLVPA